jgi:hypothetical protein
MVDLVGMVDGAARARDIIGDMVPDIGDNGNTNSLIERRKSEEAVKDIASLLIFVWLNIFFENKA